MKMEVCSVRDALAALFRHHIGMQDKFEDVFFRGVLHFKDWGEMYRFIVEEDLLTQLVEMPGSATERTLVAAIISRCGWPAVADRMLGDRAMARIADLDRDQLGIFHAIMTSR